RGKGVGQGAHQRLLPDQAGEVGRAVFSRQHAVRLGLRAQSESGVFGHGGDYSNRWERKGQDLRRILWKTAKAGRSLVLAAFDPFRMSTGHAHAWRRRGLTVEAGTTRCRFGMAATFRS